MDESHEDRSSGLRFLKKISVDTDSKLNNVHTLVGTGSKYRYGVMKLYAIGLYLPPSYAKASGTDDLVLAPVVNGEIASSLVLRINRDTDIKTFVGHIEEALRAFVNARAKDTDVRLGLVDGWEDRV